MSCLFLLFWRLVLFLQFLNKQTHLIGFGIGRMIFAAKVEEIPQPLPIISMDAFGNLSLF